MKQERWRLQLGAMLLAANLAGVGVGQDSECPPSFCFGPPQIFHISTAATLIAEADVEYIRVPVGHIAASGFRWAAEGLTLALGQIDYDLGNLAGTELEEIATKVDAPARVVGLRLIRTFHGSAESERIEVGFREEKCPTLEVGERTLVFLGPNHVGNPVLLLTLRGFWRDNDFEETTAAALRAIQEKASSEDGFAYYRWSCDVAASCPKLKGIYCDTEWVKRAGKGVFVPRNFDCRLRP